MIVKAKGQRPFTLGKSLSRQMAFYEGSEVEVTPGLLILPLRHQRGWQR